MKKIKLFCLVVLFLLSSFIFADDYYKKQKDFFIDSLARTNISFSCVNSFPVKEFRDFTTYDLGAGCSSEYIFLPQFVSWVKLGYTGRFFYQNLFTPRQEISEFYSFTLVNGLIFKFSLPNKFVLQPEFDLGFAITKVSATSVNYETLSDIYYDFVLRTALSFRRPFVEFSWISFLWDVSPFYTWQFEQTKIAEYPGVNASIIFSFNKPKTRKSK